MLDVIDATTTTTIRNAPADPLSESVASQLGNLAQTLMAHPGRLRTLALVGCGRGEGTSTLTANLGRYLATHRARVLMVDANAHAPALHAISGAGRAGGLSELMDGQIALDAAVKPTAVPDLFVLTAGERPAAGNGLLLASHLRDRLLKCATAYDFVLLDCPCVNVYEDTASVAAQCDGVILIVEGGRTLRQSARSAKQLLMRANCNLLGVFMNKRKFSIPRVLYDRL